MKIILLTTWTLIALNSFCQQDSIPEQKGTPFKGVDLTWQNGNDRRDSTLLKGKYFTGDIMIDANYNYSFNNPIDNTVVGSTALARHNEVQVSLASIGVDFDYKGARGKIKTQFGTRSTLVPRNDYSPYRGRYELANAYRYLSEAYAL